MSMTTINVRIDQQTKRDMAEVCDQLGLSMSAAFTVFAKTVAGERRIPFELNAAPFNSPPIWPGCVIPPPNLKTDRHRPMTCWMSDASAQGPDRRTHYGDR